LNDVIEHLPDPKGTLVEIRRILKSDGIVCINTPDIDSLISKILKARWWGINQAHLFYFTKKTLSNMLRSAGFSPLKFTRHPRTFSFNYWVYRFRNYNKPTHRVLKFLADHTPLKDVLLTINTADQIEVYAKNIDQI
jgi:predicted SAM-dependent methyltransferase